MGIFYISACVTPLRTKIEPSPVLNKAEKTSQQWPNEVKDTSTNPVVLLQ